MKLGTEANADLRSRLKLQLPASFWAEPSLRLCALKSRQINASRRASYLHKAGHPSNLQPRLHRIKSQRAPAWKALGWGVAATSAASGCDFLQASGQSQACGSVHSSQGKSTHPVVRATCIKLATQAISNRDCIGSNPNARQPGKRWAGELRQPLQPQAATSCKVLDKAQLAGFNGSLPHSSQGITTPPSSCQLPKCEAIHSSKLLRL